MSGSLGYKPLGTVIRDMQCLGEQIELVERIIVVRRGWVIAPLSHWCLPPLSQGLGGQVEVDVEHQEAVSCGKLTQDRKAVVVGPEVLVSAEVGARVGDPGGRQILLPVGQQFQQRPRQSLPSLCSALKSSLTSEVGMCCGVM